MRQVCAKVQAESLAPIRHQTWDVLSQEEALTHAHPTLILMCGAGLSSIPSLSRLYRPQMFVVPWPTGNEEHAKPLLVALSSIRPIRTQRGGIPVGRIVVNEEKCKGCALCSTACPYKLIVMAEWFNSKGYHPALVTDERSGECTGCALCARMCPDVAITVYR